MKAVSTATSATPNARGDLPFYLALVAVRAALAPTMKAQPTRFVVTLLSPSKDRLFDYAAAAEHVMIEHDRRHGLKDSHEIITADRPFRQAAKTLAACGRVVIVTTAGNVTRSLELATDRIETIQDVSVMHVRTAIKKMYFKDVGRTDATLIADTLWNDLKFAFLRGRQFDEAMDRLRVGASKPVRATRASEKGNLTLENAVGYGEAKTWGMTLAKDINDWKQGRLPWSDVDKGILLYGPPGTGKTMFAKALANTCEVELVCTSVARWQAAGYLNDLLAAMHASFKEAKAAAPCVLFLDEIDAVGDREDVRGDSANYQRQVINGLLEQLDGSVGRDGVIVLGATNRPDDLDPAILRPGRLERRIEIVLPSPEDRAAILEWHLGIEVPLQSRAVEETHDWSGAQLEALARSARRGAREANTTISEAFLEAALPPTTELSPADQWRIALHECGHALVGKRLELGEFKSITVRRRVSMVGGYAAAGTTEVTMNGGITTKFRYLDHIAFLVGGMAAEIAALDSPSGGSGSSSNSDLARATDIATRMVAGSGLDEYLVVEDLDSRTALRTARLTNPSVWRRVNAILQEQLERALEMTRSEIGLLKAMASKAMETGTLTAVEFEAMASLAPLPERQSSQVVLDYPDRR
jgi:cell division protease FtsH